VEFPIAPPRPRAVSFAIWCKSPKQDTEPFDGEFFGECDTSCGHEGANEAQKIKLDDPNRLC